MAVPTGINNLCNLAYKVHGLFRGFVYQQTWAPIANCKRYPGDRQQVRVHVGPHAGNRNPEASEYRQVLQAASLLWRFQSGDEKKRWAAWAKRYNITGFVLFSTREFQRHAAQSRRPYKPKWRNFFVGANWDLPAGSP